MSPSHYYIYYPVRIGLEADLARVDGAGQGQQSKYHVEVHSDASIPEGLARVLDIIQGAIKPRS